MSLARPAVVFVVLAALPLGAAAAADKPEYTRTGDVIYHRKDGMALTMDVFTPKERPNGKGVIMVVSGGWHSAHDAINTAFFTDLLGRGYTVFAVVHGSQPKYTIPEILQDMHRAVRFIRYHAKDYRIDPDQIAIMGASAGGHLSLMQGSAGKDGDPKAKDPVDQVSSRVQVVGCFFPPTDFLNYGKPGANGLGRGILAVLRAPFDFKEWSDSKHAFVPVVDEVATLKIAREISPIYHVSADDPPTLIIHGDSDKIVPIQQAEIYIAKLKDAGVETKLVVKKGADHGWKDWPADSSIIADWFDAHMKPAGGSGEKK